MSRATGMRWLTIFGLLCLNGLSHAESVLCHIDYGGEARLIEARPVNSPYTVKPETIGSNFLFRIVFQTHPVDLAGIRIYTYADHDSGPAIIHQANYAFPLTNAAVNGFTGQQSVYEPIRDGELQYWCELKTGAAK